MKRRRFLFVADDQITFDPSAVDKVLLKQDKQGAGVLRDLQIVLSNLTDWNAQTLGVRGAELL